MTPAEKIVRQIYGYVASGEFDAVLALLARDAHFEQAASLPFGGRYVGREGFTNMASRIVAAWPGFAVEPEAFMSNGAELVVVKTRLQGRGLDMPMLELWTVRDDVVAACQPFYFDTAVAAATAKENPL